MIRVRFLICPVDRLICFLGVPCLLNALPMIWVAKDSFSSQSNREVPRKAAVMPR